MPNLFSAELSTCRQIDLHRPVARKYKYITLNVALIGLYLGNYSSLMLAQYIGSRYFILVEFITTK